MNKHFGRFLLAGVCGLAAVSATSADPTRFPDDQGDDRAHPSHRLLGDIGDLAGAEDQLARRLHHTHDVQEIQDLVTPLLKDTQFTDMLEREFKDLKPDDIENLKATIEKNPQLLDDPKLHDLLKDVEKLKQGGKLNEIPEETKQSVAKWAKDFIDKEKPPNPASGNPMTGGPMNPPTHSPDPPPGGTQAAPPPQPALKPSPPPEPAKPSGLIHDLSEGLKGMVKDIDRSPEGEALRTALLRQLAKLDASSSSGFADFLKGVLSSDQAAWLAHNGKMPAGPGLGGWDAGGVAPPLGGSSEGMMDAVVWIAALVLLVAAGWMAVAVARRQAAARARPRAWSPGPWPVRPSQVSTRQDLIRAFEHLAYLLLGPVARSLNHRDVAERLGLDDGDRARAADRLAHLYEQARYAPPDEVMPVYELTAARGDLAALAGAAS